MSLTTFKNRKWQRQRNDNDAYLEDLNQIVDQVNALPGTSTVLGYFATLAALTAAHPAGANGQFAVVGNTIYIWDPITSAWITIGDTLYKGVLDASAGIPYPAAQVGEFWRISVAGVIGTTQVETGDQVICIAAYAGGMDDTKFMIIQTNTQITDVTYAQLQTLITNSALETGRQYRITDYATAYNIFDGGTNVVIEAQVGTLEPLIVLATGEATLAKEAYSELFPQDIIYYNPLVEAVERAAFIATGDIGFVTAGSLVVGFKGLIEFRHDTKQNVSTWYDFRNVKFRRWAVDAVAYDNGTAYAEKALCKGSDGKIYKCTTATIGEGDPTVNTADWILWLDLIITSYVSWTADITKLSGQGNCTSTNLILNAATYQDVYTFGSYYSLVYNVMIGKNIYTPSYKSSLNNIAFETTNSSNTCLNVTIGNYCYLFFIGSECYNTSFGHKSTKNIISKRFSDNTVSNLFSQNMIGYMSNGNYLQSSFTKNVAETITSNRIESGFTTCNLKSGFSNNIIEIASKVNAGTNCRGIYVGAYNTIVTLGNDCSGISIGEKNGTITLGATNTNISIGNGNPTITTGANCTNLTFQNGCTFSGNTAVNGLQNCLFESGTSISAVSFGTATHIKAAYNTTVFMNATPAVKLRYFDASNALTVAIVNA